jgi:hypothetical protein
VCILNSWPIGIGVPLDALPATIGNGRTIVSVHFVVPIVCSFVSCSTGWAIFRMRRGVSKTTRDTERKWCVEVLVIKNRMLDEAVSCTQ